MVEIGTPPLSEQLCFDLYAASRAVTNAYRPMLNELGLTYPQYLVMVVLWDEGTRTVRELADVLRLDHGTLTPLLRRMEAGGMITRRRANDDERFVEIALTASGNALRVHATKIHCDMTQALGLDPAQFADLQETLRTLTTNVTQWSGLRRTRRSPQALYPHRDRPLKHPVANKYRHALTAPAAVNQHNPVVARQRPHGNEHGDRRLGRHSRRAQTAAARLECSRRCP